MKPVCLNLLAKWSMSSSESQEGKATGPSYTPLNPISLAINGGFGSRFARILLSTFAVSEEKSSSLSPGIYRTEDNIAKIRKLDAHVVEESH